MEMIGRYEVRDRLGRGGFATVYRVWDPLLRREVALKALSADWAEEPAMHRRFLLEAQTLAGIEHPHIVTVYDVGEADGRPYFTMPVMEGGALTGRLQPGAPLSLAETAAIIGPLAEALDLLHARRIIHRDVKAANVMLSGSGRVTLMDLGIARDLAGPALTSHSQVMLSPEAAAPEQIRALPVGPAADIYALGILAYTLLAGRPPYTGDTAALLHAHVYATPPSLWELHPGLPTDVYAAVGAALAKDPAQRPPSAGAFARVLQPSRAVPPVAPSAGVPSSPPTAPGGVALSQQLTAPVAAAHSRRWLLTFGGGAGLALLSAGAGGWWLVQRGRRPEDVAVATATATPDAALDGSASPATTPAPTPAPAQTTTATPVATTPSTATNRIGATSDYTLARIPLVATNSIDLRLNSRRGPLADARLREAFALSVDPKLILDLLTRFPTTSSLLTSADEQALGLVLPADFDPGTGRALLATAGYPDGINNAVTFTYVNDGATVRLALLLQRQWQDNIRSTVIFRGVDQPTATADLRAGQFDLLLCSLVRG